MNLQHVLHVNRFYNDLQPLINKELTIRMIDGTAIR